MEVSRISMHEVHTSINSCNHLVRSRHFVSHKVDPNFSLLHSLYGVPNLIFLEDALTCLIFLLLDVQYICIKKSWQIYSWNSVKNYESLKEKKDFAKCRGIIIIFFLQATLKSKLLWFLHSGHSSCRQITLISQVV